MFSDGVFITSNRYLSSDMIIDTVSENIALFRRLKQRHVYSQPFANFAVHMRGIKAVSIGAVTEDLSSETYYKGVGITRDDRGYLDGRGRRMVIMHWAGGAKLKDDERFRGLWEEHFEAERALS